MDKKKVIKLTESQLQTIIENVLLRENGRPITSDEIEYFNYLNDLRDSGVTNMFGASPYLEREFDLSSREAREVLSSWMGNFKDEGYDEDTMIKQ